MKKIFKAALYSYLLMFLCVGIANATLWDCGGGLIYDDVLDITWLQDANHAMTSGYDADGRMGWFEATAWIDYLNSIEFKGYSNWRLPINDPVNGSYYVYEQSYDGSTDIGFNITSMNVEMAYLFSVELGNQSYRDENGDIRDTYGVVNEGLFINLAEKNDNRYWSGTFSERYPGHDAAWAWYMYDGWQGQVSSEIELYVWAVRDGDVDPAPVPNYSCVGFESPLGDEPVKVKKNKVIPVKAHLFDDGYIITDLDITAFPVIQILYSSGIEEAEDVSGEAYPAGMGSEGNIFEYNPDTQNWQFNLKTKNYSAPGTYTIKMISGDEQEYSLDTCTASFVIY